MNTCVGVTKKLQCSAQPTVRLAPGTPALGAQRSWLLHRLEWELNRHYGFAVIGSALGGCWFVTGVTYYTHGSKRPVCCSRPTLFLEPIHCKLAMVLACFAVHAPNRFSSSSPPKLRVVCLARLLMCKLRSITPCVSPETQQKDAPTSGSDHSVWQSYHLQTLPHLL